LRMRATRYREAHGQAEGVQYELGGPVAHCFSKFEALRRLAIRQPGVNHE